MHQGTINQQLSVCVCDRAKSRGLYNRLARGCYLQIHDDVLRAIPTARSGWVNRQQQDVIDLRDKLWSIHATDCQTYRLLLRCRHRRGDPQLASAPAEQPGSSHHPDVDRAGSGTDS